VRLGVAAGVVDVGRCVHVAQQRPVGIERRQNGVVERRSVERGDGFDQPALAPPAGAAGC
jgi:hypothetical protein